MGESPVSFRCRKLIFPLLSGISNNLAVSLILVARFSFIHSFIFKYIIGQNRNYYIEVGQDKTIKGKSPREDPRVGGPLVCILRNPVQPGSHNIYLTLRVLYLTSVKMMLGY